MFDDEQNDSIVDFETALVLAASYRVCSITVFVCSFVIYTVEIVLHC